MSKIVKIRVGTASCGIAANAGAVLEALQLAVKDIPVEGTGCIGHCYAEPLVEVLTDDQQSIYYSHVKPADVENILTLGENGRFVIPEARRNRELVKVLALAGHVDPVSYDDYVANGGYKGLERALSMTPEEVVQEMLDSGLRGRGGGGFPTGRKWSFLAAKQAEEKSLSVMPTKATPVLLWTGV